MSHRPALGHITGDEARKQKYWIVSNIEFIGLIEG
jgi:hypothetical protein